MKPMRYAHSEGHTDLCYEDTGRYMLTCGSDGDVRIWEGIDDDDAVSHRVGDRVYAVVHKNGRFFTATDTNSIQAHTFPAGGPDGIVTRFTAPATHMCFNKSGTTMVAGASDFTIKIVVVDTSSHKVCHGHEAPILSVSIDPKEEYLASSSCDGSVRVWKMDDQSVVKSWNLLQKSNDVSLSKTLCRLCWSHDGKYLFVPVEKDIHVYCRDSWERLSCIVDSQLTEIVSVICLSSDGSLLAVGCIDGSICALDWKKKKLLQKHKHQKNLPITALAWNPTKHNELAFCDNQGQLGVIDSAVTQDSANQVACESTGGQFEGVFDDDDDMLIQASLQPTVDEDSVSADAFQHKKPTQPIVDDDDEEDDGDFLKDLKSDLKGDDDDASSVSESLPPQPLPLIRDDGYKPTPLQRAFQPASTPDHLQSRFMKWNSVGIIRQYNTDEENSIDIEFHDTATHHAMHITNNMDYTMADLTTEAVVVACVGDDDSQSKLTCMHFGSWDSAKEWTVPMPEGEDIKAITAGDGWIAVGTDARNVRLFSVGGIQQELFTLPGPVVCLAAEGKQLLVVYHKGMGIPGDQCMGVSLMSVVGQKKMTFHGEHLPLSSKATLSWIGFSAEGTPFYMDSVGIVRMWNRAFGPTWIQVANTRDQAKGKSDHYWIVAVHEDPQQLRCIPCKGSRFPPTLPRPAVAILPFQIPLCEMSTEKSQYEETLQRTHLFANHFDLWKSQGFSVDDTFKADALKTSQEALMKLFALSARSDREFRALEVCELMREEHTLQLAVRYASRLKHLQLAQRISELAQQRATEQEEAQEEEDFSTELDACHNNVDTEWAHTDGHSRMEQRQDEDMAEDVDEEEHDKSSGPMLILKPREEKESTRPSFLARSNPFKVQSKKAQSKGGPNKGSQVFDSLSKCKPEKILAPLPVTLKTTKSGQRKVSTLTNMFKKKDGHEKSKENKNKEPKPDGSDDLKTKQTEKAPNAFQLWLDSNIEDLQEEHPDVSEEDLNRLAAERFKSLPKEERQTWLQKAKSTRNDENQDKKRKREETETPEIPSKNKKSDMDDIAEAKKPLSQSTNDRLKNFAFAKDL